MCLPLFKIFPWKHNFMHFKKNNLWSFQVSYRSMHTVKIRTSFCVGTNVTCRTREWSVKTRLVNSPRSTGTSVCLPACDPSVHEPLPQTFAKEAVAALFAKVHAGQCWTKLVLLEKQIFVHTCKISCLGPIRHTFTKNINDAFKYMASLPICSECICDMLWVLK